MFMSGGGSGFDMYKEDSDDSDLFEDDESQAFDEAKFDPFSSDDYNSENDKFHQNHEIFQEDSFFDEQRLEEESTRSSFKPSVSQNSATSVRKRVRDIIPSAQRKHVLDVREKVRLIKSKAGIRKEGEETDEDNGLTDVFRYFSTLSDDDPSKLTLEMRFKAEMLKKLFKN